MKRILSESRVTVMGRNPSGQDYIVGDIHGCFDQMRSALGAVKFDRERDRLFCVGDLVDRGPHSDQALEFLAEAWVFSVRGNHEQMILDLYEECGPDPDPAILTFAGRRNGMAWWSEIAPSRRTAYARAFAKLPLAIEIDTLRGRVGIVHADVPRHLHWREFLRRLSSGDDPAVTETALWGRSRLTHDHAEGVPGIGRVFVGHTIQECPRRLGNVYAVDTGAFLNLFDDQPAKLTIANLCFTTAAVGNRNAMAEPVTGPFGNYATGAA